MNLTARIEAAEGGLCTLVGVSELSMSGKAAAFGGRMMSTVADQILKQFADNFAGQVERAAGVASGAPAAPRRRRDARAGADSPAAAPRPLNAARARVDAVQGLAARPVLQDGLREPVRDAHVRDPRPAAPARGGRLRGRGAAGGGAAADAGARPPAAGGGRRRRRQDRNRQGARAGTGRATDPAAVLRRPRCAQRDVRMELPAAIAGNQAAGAR